VSRGAEQGFPAERSRPRRRRRIVLADRRPAGHVARNLVELEEQTSVGEALLRHLMRAQLRTALVLFGIAVAIFGALPVLFWAVPAVGSAVVLGLRLPWLVLGVLPFPFVLLIGYLGARAAERHERDFLDLVDQ
jgi:hypothetical protein